MRGVSFEVAPGEVFGFLGPNGAGKTTTINMLCTLAQADRAAARASPATTSSRERDDVRRNIGLVFQDPTLDGYLTAEQNLRLHAELYGVDVGAGRAAHASRCSRWSACGTARTRRSMTFSGGMRRRLEIARGLMHSPRVLFLDEPTIGLDPQTRSSIWRYIRELQGARGDHDLHDHALHGRGRVLRPDRDHGPRRDRRARHARGAEGAASAPTACAIQTDDDEAAIAALARALRHRGARSSEGAVTFCVPVGRGVRAAAVRRARRADPLGQRLAADARRRLHVATPARRSATPRRTRRQARNRMMMQMMTGGRR